MYAFDVVIASIFAAETVAPIPVEVGAGKVLAESVIFDLPNEGVFSGTTKVDLLWLVNCVSSSGECRKVSNKLSQT